MAIASNYCPCYPFACSATYEYFDFNNNSTGPIDIPVGTSTTIADVLTYSDGLGGNWYSDFIFETRIECDKLFIDWRFTPLDPSFPPTSARVGTLLEPISPCQIISDTFTPYDNSTRTIEYDFGCGCNEFCIDFTHLKAFARGGGFAVALPGFRVQFCFEFKQCE
jgi:hypothetical protein